MTPAENFAKLAEIQKLPQRLPHLLRGFMAQSTNPSLGLPVVWCDLLPGFDREGGMSLFVVCDPMLAKCPRCRALWQKALVDLDREKAPAPR